MRCVTPAWFKKPQFAVALIHRVTALHGCCGQVWLIVLPVGGFFFVLFLFQTRRMAKLKWYTQMRHIKLYDIVHVHMCLGKRMCVAVSAHAVL